MYPRNNATPERIAVGQVILIADGTVQTSAVLIVVRGQGGAEGAGAGTTAYGADGTVYYTPTQAETNYTSFVVIAYKASCLSVSQTIITTASATAGKVVLSGETHTSAVIPTVSTVTDGAKSATALSTATWTGTKAGYIDVAISSRNATTPPTAAAIVNEWETQSQADPTGFHVNVLEVGSVAQTGNDNGADINTLLTRIVGTLAAGTHNPATAAQIAVLSDWIDGGRLDLILDIIAVDTTTDIPALIAALNDISSANVLTQVNAALDTAIAELGVAAPTATPTLRTGLMLLYMMTRNRVDVDTTGTDAIKIYNNAGTQIASKAVTDDGTDYSEAEMS